MAFLPGVFDMTSSAEAIAKTTRPSLVWEDIPAGDEAEFIKARTELLNLVQWPARIANSYVTAKMPEDRVLLEFRSADPAFITQTFAHEVALEIRLANLRMQFLDHGRPVPHIFDPEEHSPAKVEAWLLVELLHRGIDRTKFSKKLPYPMPDLMTGDAEDHAPQECEAGLVQIMTWYRNAAAVLSEASGPGKLIVFPKTLELVLFPKSGQPKDRGFSIGNNENSEPHFYFKKPGEKKRSVLAASQLNKEKQPGRAVVQFLSEAA
jgi:hypothetical protein